ncbi:Protein of unknown function (DUF1765) domain containing protein [Elaphomyces granulatus]
MVHSTGDVQISLPPSTLSHSSPLGLPHSTEAVQSHGSSSPLHRAASYNSVVQLEAETIAPEVEVRKSFSDLALSTKSEPPSKENFFTNRDILRRVSLRTPNGKSKIAVSRFTLSTEELNEAVGFSVKDEATESTEPDVAQVDVKELDDNRPPSSSETKLPDPETRPSKARSVSGKIATLARKSWMPTSSSRSPSPSAKDSKRKTTQSREQSPLRTRVPSPKLAGQQDSDHAKGAVAPSKNVLKKPPLEKRTRRPLSVLVSRAKPDESNSPPSPSSLSLRSKTSFEKLRSTFALSTPVLPPLPKAVPLSLPAHMEPSRKKDELWSVFRALESDYQKFQSKAGPLKVNVIRSALLPFLTRYSDHPSNETLRPEDLDRRVNVLNKWWTCLLEMLNGKKNQSISGTDRPVYLEAIAGIMMRPEWRLPFFASDGSTLSQPVSTAGSKNSCDSSGSDFLVESIYHNTRNIFVQNLLSQMAFVADRMSMRHVPASLVGFCGKACAYAFFFCPGVADMLIRLWNTPPEVLRRVLGGASIYRGLEQRSVAQELASSFPPAVRAFALTSHAALVRYLRQKPSVPLSTAQISWQGPWNSRWCGRDTDLFFVFVKYFHVILAEFLHPETEKAKRILAPGVLSVHAQLLVVLEDTLYKQSIPQQQENPHTTSPVTFDDFIEGPDVSVSATPLGVANCHRSMAENRLIILLRDFLSETSRETNPARQIYAESFCGVLKAAASKTSLFDHNACFVLCDFIEEAITIISRYSQEVQVELFDWDFWFSVCRQMIRSHNSLTEVRVFAFIFCVWNTWTGAEERKRDLCLDFLLHEDIFYHYFSHWSPMVRAYFHRLLCWRVSRYNGDPSPLDTIIYETLSDRLEQVWAYYLSFQSKATKELKTPLSSAPCSPAPGRRIIIIRNDNQPSPGNFFVSFDRIVPPSSSGQATAYRNHGSLKLDSASLPPESQTQKKRWSILKTMFSSPANPKPGEVTPPGSSSDESDIRTINGNSVISTSSNRYSNENGYPVDESIRPPRTPHQPFCFKFSLEWLERPQWPSKNKRLFTPCLPVAAQLHLQYRRSIYTAMSDHESGSGSDSDSGRENKGLRQSRKSKKARYSAAAAVAAATKMGTETPPIQPPSPLLDERLVASKYAGRALAEWAQVVSECDNFFERRRDEGVPCDRLVETPTLGVESFRK